MKISQRTIDEVARAQREYPDGIHTCAELQRLEPGRRPCTCGRCSQPAQPTATSELQRLAAECHQRKWQYEKSSPETFDELHRMGNRILDALRGL